jgi:hypothetical protein
MICLEIYNLLMINGLSQNCHNFAYFNPGRPISCGDNHPGGIILQKELSADEDDVNILFSG